MYFASLSETIKIFFAYAQSIPGDKEFFEGIRKQLKIFRRTGLIDEWRDSEMGAGTEVQKFIDTYMAAANIIVLLISSDFLDLEEKQLERAFKLREAGKAHILAVLLRPVVDGWSRTFIDVLPSGGKPIVLWPNKDLAFAEVAGEIGKVIEQLARKIINTVTASSEPKFPIWYMEHRQNPFFTGRTDVFAALHGNFHRGTSHCIQSLNGMGGIGKTQIAIEYAYRYRGTYQAVIWIQGSSRELLESELFALAHALSIPERDCTHEQKLLAAIKRWFQCHSNWLLIIDDIGDFELMSLFVPSQHQGHILLTTQKQATGMWAHPFPLSPMTLEESTSFLIHRARITISQIEDDKLVANYYQQAREIVLAVSAHPLALDQAGAYIEETQKSLIDYLTLYRRHSSAFLGRRGQLSHGHPESVKATLTLAFQEVSRRNPLAMELLQLLSFFYPDAIPDAIILEGTTLLQGSLQLFDSDPFAFDDAISALRCFSLVHHHADTTILSIFPVMQGMIKDGLSSQMHRSQSEIVVKLVNNVFPDGGYQSWKRCQRYFAQAQHCADYIVTFSFRFKEAADLLKRLGNYAYERACYDDAERFLTHAHHLYEELQGPEHLDTVDSLSALAYLAMKQGKFSDAMRLLQQSLNICELRFGSDHPEIAQRFNGFALLLQNEGKYIQAESFYQRALAIYEVQKLNHIDLAATLNNLASLYHDQKKYVLAERLYNQALALRESILPLTHPDIAESMNNIAHLYYDMKQYERAESLFQRALEICEATIGSDHPDFAHSLNNLAACYDSMQRYTQAEELYQRVFSIYKRAYTPDHPEMTTPINNLAYLYDAQNDYIRAEQLYQQSLAICEKSLGTEHPDTARALSNLGNCYFSQGIVERAEPLLVQALAIREHVLGLDHPDTVQSLSNLAELYRRQNRLEHAEALFLRALVIQENEVYANHIEVEMMLEKYASLLSLLQREDEALHVNEMVSYIRRKRNQ